MKLCWFNDNRFGLVQGRDVLDVTEALNVINLNDYPIMGGDPVVTHLSELRPVIESLASSAKAYPISEVKFLSPVARPTKIIGTPANYLKHVEEAEADSKTFSGRYSGPVMKQGLFLKSVSSLVGASEGINLRFPDRRTDHEMELGVVIGKKCSQISEAQAFDYVAGYAIALDIVLRGPEDRSFRKSIDSYSVLGPWITLADEINDPNNLDFSLLVNGEPRQQSNTRYMILSLAKQIAWASEFYTLWPGDIIMTGTCEGVAQILPGDLLQCQIESVGQMEVRVR